MKYIPDDKYLTIIVPITSKHATTYNRVLFDEQIFSKLITIRNNELKLYYDTVYDYLKYRLSDDYIDDIFSFLLPKKVCTDRIHEIKYMNECSSVAVSSKNFSFGYLSDNTVDVLKTAMDDIYRYNINDLLKNGIFMADFSNDSNLTHVTCSVNLIRCIK